MTLKHLHRYVRSNRNKDIYMCAHPDCTHFNRAERIVGKRAECFICGAEMLVEKSQAITYKTKKLTCLNCSKSKKAKEMRDTKDMIVGILEEVGVLTSASDENETNENGDES